MINRDARGFTLIEIITVAGIIGFVGVFLIISFSRNRTNIEETASLFMSDVREAQSRAVSSVKLSGHNTCGYGITYINSTHYALYGGPDASTNNCASLNRNYDGGQDTIVFTRAITDTRLQFSGVFSDIFFEPPDPKTYFNNNSALTQPSQNITISKIGGTCPNDCRTIKIFISGKLEK